MTRHPRALFAATVGGVAASAVAVRVARADDATRRRWRLWRLALRNGRSFVTMKARQRVAQPEDQAALRESFVLRSAADVASVLGGMKGAIMKAGQMVSFMAEGLPEAARDALASLQADAPPMAAGLAEQIVAQELGRPARQLFAEWDEHPVAAASIGQVHRAVMPDGRAVAVKVQYPGVRDAIGGDLQNAEMLYNMFSAFALRNLDVRAMVDELRERMADELDYRVEAGNQRRFAERYAGHPFIRIPAVIEELSTDKVLVTEWVDGEPWSRIVESTDAEHRNQVAETILRFALGSIFFYETFNGDPHPGNYRFHGDGTTSFLDFGLVKAWAPGELGTLAPLLDAVLEGDASAAVAAASAAGVLTDTDGVEVSQFLDYVRGPYEPFTHETFTYTSEWASSALRRFLDVEGRYAPVMARLDMPRSYVILDRVVWGLSSMMGRLRAEGPWRAILQEYRTGAPPSTPLGELEAKWRAEANRRPLA